MSALGAAGSSLLKSGGGYLFDKAKPILNKISSYFTNAFGGDKTSNLGQTVMDKMYNHGIDQVFDGVNKFASSDYLKRKIPILAPSIGGAAEGLRHRLNVGYNAATGGGGDTAQSMDGIERQR